MGSADQVDCCWGQAGVAPIRCRVRQFYLGLNPHKDEVTHCRVCDNEVPQGAVNFSKRGHRP